jgi:predicted metal-dependent phosphoesterase TrpH
LLSFDLHIHSKYSYDSLMHPKTILKMAERKGLNAIAVTDHNTIRGGVEALQVSRKSDFAVSVIVGAEICTSIGDIIGLFLENEIRSKKILDVIDDIKEQGGLVVVPHPFKSHKFVDVQKIVDQIDLLEISNSRTRITSEQSNLLKALNKTLIGCSDAHFPQEIGLCRSIIDAESMTIDEIQKLLTHPSNITVNESYGSSLFQSLSIVTKLIKSKISIL